MPDFYFKTVGEAWAAIMNQFTAFQYLTYQAPSFSITWNSGGTPNGGFWRVAGTVSAGEAYANGDYYAAEAVSTNTLPFGNILRQPGMSLIPRVRESGTAGDESVLQLLDWLYSARRAMFSDITDAVQASFINLNGQLNGASNPVVYRKVWTVKSDNDQAIDWASLVNIELLPATSALSEPVNPQYIVSAAPIVNNLIQAAPSLDTDVTVNPGGGVYSITSRQFTNE